MGIDWQGSRVLVTGASSGIGAGLAEQFAIRGAVVAVNGRDEGRLGATAELCRRHGATVHELPADLGDAGAVDRLASDAVAAMGGVDVLVNNAGIFAAKPFLESTAEDLERFFETNVKGTYLVTQAVVPLMIEGKGGSIINVGAALVEQGMAGIPVSAAMTSKGGVHALTVSLAAELARHDIRVNTLAPGIIRTPLVENPDSLASIHPLGRIGEVRDTSDAAIFLATAGFVTGTTLAVDGGYAHGR
jgi:NAD(P)-dependent dehydrogenase (short-subunit alcohol dehydrogenase family)